MASSEISYIKQTIIPSKGIFKKVIELADSSKAPKSGDGINPHNFKGVSIEFSNGMTLTQLPNSNKVTLDKESSEEEFQGASLASDGKKVIIKNDNYKETIFNNGSIQYCNTSGYLNNSGFHVAGYVVDKDHRKTTAKFIVRTDFFSSKIQVHRNINGKDIYEFPNLAAQPFISLTELNKVYWPRK